MRTSRAYIASLGTTGVLIASGFLLLVVVSAIVAFQGWPGQGLLNGLGSLTLDEERPALALSGPEQVALDAAPAAGAVAAAPAPGSAAAARGASTAGAPDTFAPGVTPGSPPSFVGPGSPSPTATNPPEGVGGPAPPDTVPEGVRRLTGDLGNTTEAVTGDIGETVRRVNPQLGDTVTETGRNLNKLVQGLGLPPGGG